MYTCTCILYLLMRYILVYLYQGLQYITTHRYCIMRIYTCTHVHMYTCTCTYLLFNHLVMKLTTQEN